MTADHSHDNPFPGLRPFHRDEDHLFFGRERHVDELLRRLRTTRFLSVVGASGSGKSSLVRSGLIPSLYSGYMTMAGSSWRVAITRPGHDPIGRLAERLAPVLERDFEGLSEESRTRKRTDATDTLKLKRADVFDDPDSIDRPKSSVVFDVDPADLRQTLVETTLRRSDLGLTDAVREARLPDDENVLVVVDQFEELFRFQHGGGRHRSRDEALAFVKVLLAAAEQDEVPLYVVLTMRSDYIGNCMDYPGLPEAVNEGQYLVPRMTRDELRTVITGPVAVAGGEISHRLVMRILNELGESQDQLPILQHALMRTWDHWRQHAAPGEAVDIDHYDEIGTMGWALSKHAQVAYGELGDPQRPDEQTRAQRIAETVFKSLTDTATDPRGVRTPTPLAQLCELAGASRDEVVEVIDAFRAPGRSFLMPPYGEPLEPDTRIDISHESLMRVWVQLIQWTQEEAHNVAAYMRLSREAELYPESRGPLRDTELDLALRWQDDAQPTEAWARRYAPNLDDVNRFIDESVAARDEEIVAAEAERKKGMRRAYQLAGLGVVVAIAMTGVWLEARYQAGVAAAASAEAQRESRRAERQRERAQERAVEARLAQREAERERIRARERAREATRARREATRLNEALTQAQGETAAALISTRDALADAEQARIEADASRALAVFQKNLATFLERRARSEAERADAEAGRAERLRLQALARELAIRTLQAPDSAVREVAALAHFAFVLNADNGGSSSDPDIHVALRTAYDRLISRSRRLPAAIRYHVVDSLGRTARDPVRVVILGPDGRMVTGTDSGFLWVKGSLADLLGFGTTSREADSDVAGEHPANGVRTAELGASVRALAYDADGSVLAVGTADGRVHLQDGRNAARSRRVLTMPDAATGSPITALTFLDDGRLVVGDAAGRLAEWPLGGGDPTGRTIVSGPEVRAVADRLLDGNLVVATRDGARLLDPGGRVVRTVCAGADVRAIAVSPNGDVACGVAAGSVLLVLGAASRGGAATGADPAVDDPPASEPQTGLRRSRLVGHRSPITRLRFSPDGSRLASASMDSTIRLWNMAERDRAPIVLSGHASWVWDVVFGPSGEAVLSASEDGTVRAWPTRGATLAAAVCEILATDPPPANADVTDYLPPDLSDRDWRSCPATSGDSR